jgi:hypothetical protein
MIDRLITQKLLTLIKEFPAVGILGPRQSGKTTLAKYIQKFIKRETVYIDVEYSRDFRKLSDPELFLEQNSDKCVIIDEVQRMPSIIESLRALIDIKRKPGRFILLGSANPFLLRKSSESLAGRISSIELSPFNLLEIEDKYKMEKHWFLGGFPNSLLAKKISSSQNWLNSFVNSYIERDLPAYGLNASSETLFKLWSFIASAQGSVFNASRFSKSLAVSYTMVNKYVEYFLYSYMVFKLYPFYHNARKRLVKSPKLYVRDSGILHSLCGIQSFDLLQKNLILGYSFEGYVIEQIRQLKNDRIQIYFYRTQDGAECDLVFVKSNKPIAAAEIKYSNAPEVRKSLSVTIQDLATESNFIITPHSEDYLIRKNIRVCNLIDFLKIHLPKIK